jgi:hypothetical protein
MSTKNVNDITVREIYLKTSFLCFVCPTGVWKQREATKVGMNKDEKFPSILFVINFMLL